MTSRIDLEALASRVEAAEAADRELDAEIWTALGLVPEAHCRSWCRMDGRTDLTPAMFVAAHAPAYTASIDAALQLLPGHEGVGWRMTDGAGGPTAEVWCFDFDEAKELYHVGAMPCWTPALAMCAAALRARAVQP